MTTSLSKGLLDAERAFYELLLLAYEMMEPRGSMPTRILVAQGAVLRMPTLIAQAEAMERELAAHSGKRQEKPVCSVCSKPCNPLAGNPLEWPVEVHRGCVGGSDAA